MLGGSVIDAAADATDAQLGCDGSSFLLVYSLGGRVLALPLDASGRPSADRPKELAASDSANPLLAYLAPSYLVAWTRTTQATGRDVVAALVTGNGATLGPSLITVSATSANETLAGVAAGVSSFLVDWANPFDLQATSAPLDAARIDPTGVVLDASGIALGSNTGMADNGHMVTTGSVGDRFVVLSGGIDEVRVRADGTLVDPTAFQLSTEWLGNHHGAVASDGSGFMTAGGAEVLIDSSGEITPPKTAVQNGSNAIAWDGQYYVADQDHPNCVPNPNCDCCFPTSPISYASLFSRSGEEVLTTRVPEFQPTFVERIASSGSDILLVRRGGAQRFSLDLTPIDAQATDLTPCDLSDALADPAGYVILCGTDSRIVSRDGSIETRAATFSKASSNGVSDLVAWKGPNGIRARFFSPGLVAPLGPTLLVSNRSAAAEPAAVTWDGSEYLVSWTEPFPDALALFTARVSDDGHVMDPGGILVEHDVVQPAVASSTQGTTAFVYLALDPPVTGRVRRLQRRMLFTKGTPVDGGTTPLPVGLLPDAAPPADDGAAGRGAGGVTGTRRDAGSGGSDGAPDHLDGARGDASDHGDSASGGRPARSDAASGSMADRGGGGASGTGAAPTRDDASLGGRLPTAGAGGTAVDAGSAPHSNGTGASCDCSTPAAPPSRGVDAFAAMAIGIALRTLRARRLSRRKPDQ